MKQPTKSEINLINLCNHTTGTDTKVEALRKYVARAVKSALKKQAAELVSVNPFHRP